MEAPQYKSSFLILQSDHSLGEEISNFGDFFFLFDLVALDNSRPEAKNHNYYLKMCKVLVSLFLNFCLFLQWLNQSSCSSAVIWENTLEKENKKENKTKKKNPASAAREVLDRFWLCWWGPIWSNNQLQLAAHMPVLAPRVGTALLVLACHSPLSLGGVQECGVRI